MRLETDVDLAWYLVAILGSPWVTVALGQARSISYRREDQGLIYLHSAVYDSFPWPYACSFEAASRARSPIDQWSHLYLAQCGDHRASFTNEKRRSHSPA